MTVTSNAPPRSDTTALEVTLLALLDEREMHPYEMLRTLRQRRQDRLVKVRAGSLYHCVERLADKGYARVGCTECVGNRPERTTYRLTDAGRAALSDWVAEHLTRVQNGYPLLPVALGEAHLLRPARVARLLEQRCLALDEQIDDLQHTMRGARDRGVLEAYLLSLTYTLTLLRAEREYLRGIVSSIDTEELTWPAR